MRYFVILFLLISSCNSQTIDDSDLLTYIDTVEYKGNKYIISGFYNKNSLQVGKWVSIKNGDTASIDYYQEGIRHGRSLGFYANGQMSHLGNYVEGQPNGIEKLFDYDGNLVKKIYYNMGEVDQAKTVTYRDWQPNGSSTTIYVGDSVGYYQWLDGKKKFVRKLTNQEIEQWKEMNKN
jgi:antitoxin component YwqK of YwqJK toxin-antitoxin module